MVKNDPTSTTAFVSEAAALYQIYTLWRITSSGVPPAVAEHYALRVVRAELMACVFMEAVHIIFPFTLINISSPVHKPNAITSI